MLWIKSWLSSSSEIYLVFLWKKKFHKYSFVQAANVICEKQWVYIWIIYTLCTYSSMFYYKLFQQLSTDADRPCQNSNVEGSFHYIWTTFFSKKILLHGILWQRKFHFSHTCFSLLDWQYFICIILPSCVYCAVLQSYKYSSHTVWESFCCHAATKTIPGLSFFDFEKNGCFKGTLSIGTLAM